MKAAICELESTVTQIVHVPMLLQLCCRRTFCLELEDIFMDIPHILFLIKTIWIDENNASWWATSYRRLSYYFYVDFDILVPSTFEQHVKSSKTRRNNVFAFLLKLWTIYTFEINWKIKTQKLQIYYTCSQTTL